MWWAPNYYLGWVNFISLTMDMMSLCILCKAGLKHTSCCQFARNYVRNYKKAQSEIKFIRLTHATVDNNNSSHHLSDVGLVK